MHRRAFLATLICALVAVLLVPASAFGGELIDALKPLEPFVGKTWKGEFKGSTPENPRIDVARWEKAMGGKAIRVVHSINDGEYGGEMILFSDPESGELTYFYFTTAGFYTQGTLEVWGEGKFTGVEDVKGNAQGITQVKSMSEILPDGRLRGTSKYLKKGEWVEGHEIHYVEDPDAEVVFE